MSPLTSNTKDVSGSNVYHTNVIMSLGEKIAVLCEDAIPIDSEKKQVKDSIQRTGHEIINISSDFGKYNSLNFNTIFSKNVIINYIDNEITSEYLDYSMIKNKIIISKNVIYKNLENILKADVIELDTLSKDTKIFMHSTKQQVIIKSIN